LAGIAFRALRTLIAERTDWTWRAGNTLNSLRSLVALRPLVSDGHRFNDHVGLDHFDVELGAGFDRQLEVGATQVNVNRWAIRRGC
jgi:hypothetical protein